MYTISVSFSSPECNLEFVKLNRPAADIVRYCGMFRLALCFRCPGDGVKRDKLQKADNVGGGAVS
jgi:hypothetical protein